ncbi:hypothetical protein FO519_009376 [Halicephalobus sp. NKZ332]|nr:hypothetical protein FO519_009376 [Halicephalobus sp. NKZ332]
MIVAVDTLNGIGIDNTVPWDLPSCRDMPESISENLIFINSFEKALKLLTEEEPYKSKIETIWNIGGKDLYILGLAHPWMHKLVISRIEKAYVMDLKFPEINWKNFELNDDFDGKPVEDNGVIYRTLSYTRKADP